MVVLCRPVLQPVPCLTSIPDDEVPGALLIFRFSGCRGHLCETVPAVQRSSTCPLRKLCPSEPFLVRRRERERETSVNMEHTFMFWSMLEALSASFYALWQT